MLELPAQNSGAKVDVQVQLRIGISQERILLKKEACFSRPPGAVDFLSHPPFEYKQKVILPSLATLTMTPFTLPQALRIGFPAPSCAAMVREFGNG